MIAGMLQYPAGPTPLKLSRYAPNRTFDAMWKAGLLLLVLIAAGLWTYPRLQRCSPRLRLDLILGGGAPVCLGGYTALLSESDDAEPSEDGSNEDLKVQDGGRTYWYTPAGGVDLIVARPFGRIYQACVEGLAVTTRTDWLYQRVASRIGGPWTRRNSVGGRRAFSEWSSPAGIYVGDVQDGRACVRLRGVA